MTKIKKTIVTVALFAATLLCALFAAFAATPVKTFADDAVDSEEPATVVENYNIYDFNQASWPNGNFKNFLSLDNSTEEVLDFECTADFGSNNFIYRNPYMYLEKDVTYTVSFKIKTFEEVERRKTWSISTRFVVDGDAGATAGSYGEGAVTGVKGENIADWKEIKYTFTPSKTSSIADNNKNCFDFIFAGFAEEDCVQIKDIRVEYPKSALEAKGNNVYNGTIKPANPTQEKNITKSEETDPEYGTVTKFVCDVDLTTVGSNPAVFMRTNVEWKENVKYSVSFMYKTVKAAGNNGSFKSSYAHIRAKGKANTSLGNIYYANGTAASMSANGSQWKMFNYEFTLDALKEDTSRAENVFEFCLNPFQKGDEFYVADIHIMAQCAEHTYEAAYDWADDNTTCTAKLVCSGCDHVSEETETVNTTVNDTATCLEDGTKTYTATFEGEKFTVQTKEEESKAKGHTYGEATYTWNEDNTKCTASKSCAGCDDKIEETVDAVASENSATCTEAGKITYTATFEDEAFETQTKDVDTPAKGHDYKDGKCSVCEAADPDYKEEKSGCGASTEVSAVVLMALIAAMVVIVKKNAKKEE